MSISLAESADRSPSRVGAVPNTEIIALREQFLSAPAETDLSALRPIIARSWQRSLACNVSSRGSFLDSSDPHVDEQLLLAAEPVLSELEGLCLDVGGSVVLSDSDGTVAVFRGDAVERRRAERIFPTFGARMSEDLVGTNSEGTALEEGVAVQVWGAEHFNEDLQRGYCTSAPVRDPIRRSVRGVLSVMLPERVAKDIDPKSILLTVNGAAADISRRLAERLAAREQALMTEYMREVRKRGADAVVAMDDRTTIASRSALNMFDQSDFAVLAALAREAEQAEGPTRRRLNVNAGQEVLIHAKPMNLRDIGAGHATVMRVHAPSPVTHQLPAKPKRSTRSYLRDFIGTSWAFKYALDSAGTAISRKMPAYIIGEPGTGKRMLAEAIASRLGAETYLIDFYRDPVDSRIVELIDRHLAQGVAVVLHRVEFCGPGIREGLVELLQMLEQPPLIVTACAVTDDLLPLLSSLRGIEVSLPPLRSRREDIQALSASFIGEAFGQDLRLSAKLLAAIIAADWPGNVAQLRGLIGSISTDSVVGEVRVSDLPEVQQRLLRTARLTRLEEAELQQIRAALAESGHNRGRAATLLGIGRSTLYRKIERYEARGFSLELSEASKRHSG